MKKLLKVCTLAALIVSPLVVAPSVMADSYPNRPVKFVVPWPAGDLEDVLTRIIAEEMSKETGKPATVVNKPGGGGVVGATEVSRSRTDGLMIGSFVVDLVTTQLLAGNAPYDENTFEPVGIFLDYPFALATRASSPYNNLKELAAYSQANKVSLGHFGYQALPTAITFKAAAQEGIRFSSDAAFDSNDCSTLANGDADVVSTTTQQILACLKSGDVKLIAAITNDRISIAPDVPTLKEQTGITQTTWNGLFVKHGTPRAIKDRIAEIAQKALQDQRVVDLSRSTGAGVFWIGGVDAEKVVAKDYKDARDLMQYINR